MVIGSRDLRTTAGQGGVGTPKRRVLFITDFYREDLLAGIVEFAREAGWEIDADMRFHGRFPRATRADGILATITTERVLSWLDQRANCPVVRMLANEHGAPYPGVEADYRAAGQVGARHLLELGHAHLAFYCERRGPETMEALAGFQAELTIARRTAEVLEFAAAHPELEFLSVATERRHRWLAGELRRLPRPLAVMCDDDRRALELLSACELAGLRVPEDVAVLGCDNHWVEIGMARPSLSSVEMNFRGIGQQAAEVLQTIMNGAAPPASARKVAPIGVVARQSTATFVTDSPGVTQAVLHLRAHFKQSLRLVQLAKLAGMSERSFETAFKHRVGRTARSELQRVRLACAARLLRDTDLKLSAIAAESGFGSASKLCRAFADTYGVSPRIWRLQVRDQR